MTITDTTQTYRELPIDSVKPSTDNIRQHLGDLDELIASIQAIGILEPIIVDPDHVVLAGHRRLAAAFEAGLTHVPVIVRQWSSDSADQVAETALVMLVENLQRAGLDPIEEATGYSRLAASGMSQHDIAAKVGCNQSHVSKRLSLMKLPDVARTLVSEGRLTVKQAEELAKADEADVAEITAAVVKESERRTGELPDWIVKDAVDHLARTRKYEAAEKAGKASKLKRLDRKPYHGAGEHEPCKKAEATHWHLGAGESTITWARARSKGAPAADGTTSSSSSSTSDWQERQRIAIARKERIDETLTAGVQHVGRERFVALANELAVRVLSENLAYLELQSGANGFDDVPEDWDHDDHALLVAIRLLEAITGYSADSSEEFTDVDRWTLAALAELGYELDDTERAALGVFWVEPTLDQALIVDERPDDAEPGEQLGGFADAEAEVWALDTDPRSTEAPWKAYPFVEEIRLIGGIREHGNADKLRHAQVYERANKNRPLVLAALAERVAELTTA